MGVIAGSTPADHKIGMARPTFFKHNSHLLLCWMRTELLKRYPIRSMGFTISTYRGSYKQTQDTGFAPCECGLKKLEKFLSLSFQLLWTVINGQGTKMRENGQ